MAKEINTKISCSIASKGSSKAAGDISFAEDLSGSFVGFQVTIGSTSAAAINLGTGVTAPKVVFIQNNDATNFVQIDNVSGMTGWPQKILPNTGILIRPQNSTLFGKADQAPVAVWIVAG
jgi:hypothetical protein